MRVAGIRAPGRPVEPMAVDAPRELAADEIRIAVAAAGVGYWDGAGAEG